MTTNESSGMREPQVSRRALAVHEAGHVVVTIALGGRITSSVSIIPDRRSLGRHEYSFGDGPHAPLKKAVSGVAGSEAESVLIGRVGPAISHDLAKARALAPDPESADRWVGESRQRARDILYAQFAAVSQLASSLEQKGELTAVEATKIVEKHWVDDEPRNEQREP